MSLQLPRILALETSGRQGSVALARGPELLALRELSPATRHAAELMPAVRDLTAAQGWSPAGIDQIHLSIGPGSFTGLRIAVAAARALQQAVGCKLVAVPSLEVIAQNAPVEFALVMPILDARRNQVFASAFRRDAQGALEPVMPPQLLEQARLVESMLALQRRTIADVPRRAGKMALLGEGLAHYQPPPDSGITALPPEYWPASAVHVHRLGHALAQRGAFADPAALLPLYIRLPEAEEVYQRRHAAP